MAWNEPGGGDKDPWGGGSRNEQGPPDLDEVFKKFQDKLNKMFGGKGGGAGGAGSGAGGSFGIGLILLAVLALWGFSGFYIIDPAERGVVMRFGQYTTTTTPGPHWHLPVPIERVEKVNVDNIRVAEIGFRSGGRQGGGSVEAESLMLTQDENIVSIELVVQYKVKDARDYLFKVRDPDATLRQATESALREIIGKSKMDFVITEGRGEVASRAEVLIQEILDRYNTGLQLTSVNMQDLQPPEQVQAAFADVVKAREDEQRLKNEAEAYSNDIIPKARGASARQMEEANAYRDQVIAQAEGESSRFEKVLREYSKAPRVTRERLYIEAMEKVLANSGKVMVDVKGGNNLLYLPLDKLAPGSGDGRSSGVIELPGSTAPATSSNDGSRSSSDRLRESLRNNRGGVR